MISDKQSVNHLVQLCEEKGVQNIIFSPGSRNAALVLAFTKSKIIKCYVIPDERVAAFMALGMSISTQQPTVICCTSGSAALNYAPAISEAFYQGVPLIVITADRPREWIDQGVGQSIRQNRLYANYVKGSYELIGNSESRDALWYNSRTINEAINLSTIAKPGPVHINFPFSEPLYNQIDDAQKHPVNTFDEVQLENKLRKDSKGKLADIWLRSQRKVILMGQSQVNPELENLLSELVLREDIILLSETCSNIAIDNHIQCIDRVITTFEGEESLIKPDLLISIGGPVVSKIVKKLFNSHKPEHHWYVAAGEVQDTFQSLSYHLRLEPESLMEFLVKNPSANNRNYQKLWNDRYTKLQELHQRFCEDAAFSDFKVFELITKFLKKNTVVHASNSTPVRYQQLFDRRKDLIFQANRGVSGIDGCSSTAMGYALHSGRENVLITGDIAFFYDSNAFWHQYHPANFKIVLINNAGGGIFRIIDGPSTTEQLEEYFEARHQHTANHIAAMYNIPYEQIQDPEDLVPKLSQFLNKEINGISILEILTPPEANDQVLKNYFQHLKA